MADSVFTLIIRGELPAHKIYEDDKIIAFLDIHPKQPGHVLVVPKKQVEYIWDLSDDDYQALMKVCKKVALKIREVFQPPRVAMQVEGIGVPHTHVHLFPFDTVEEFHTIADVNKEPDHDALAKIAAKLAL